MASDNLTDEISLDDESSSQALKPHIYYKSKTVKFKIIFSRFLQIYFTPIIIFCGLLILLVVWANAWKRYTWHWKLLSYFGIC